MSRDATAATAHFPGRAPIDAYGNGGFRFADMSHRGSILCLPSGVYAWEPRRVDELAFGSFGRVMGEAGELQILLLGTGTEQIFPARALRDALEAGGFGVEPMSTGAAARTYNVLLGEGRRVAAALLAVE